MKKVLLLAAIGCVFATPSLLAQEIKANSPFRVKLLARS